MKISVKYYGIITHDYGIITHDYGISCDFDLYEMEELLDTNAYDY